MRGRREVCSPCTSSWIFTPCSRANAPHSASALPICSSVRSSGTSLGRPFGRTFTLGEPMSCANFTHAFVSSTFFRTRAGSAEWYSHVVPRPPILTGESVKLRTTHRHGVELALSPAARAEVRTRCTDSPVKIGGLGTACEYHSADPVLVRKNVDETKAWVKLAQDIGSPSVKVRPNGLPRDVPEERTLEQIGKALAECGAFAREHGVKIQLEVHGEQTSRLPRIRRILDYAGNDPGVKVCWNSNQTDLLDGGFESNFRLVRDQIGQVHMRDLFLEEYPWRSLISALSAMRFDGCCFAEIPE